MSMLYDIDKGIRYGKVSKRRANLLREPLEISKKILSDTNMKFRFNPLDFKPGHLFSLKSRATELRQ